MYQINTETLSKEINDTLIHRACVMRCGIYLARYLIHKNQSVDAIKLIYRCSIHDISKIQNTAEFMALASIVENIKEMGDVEHVLSDIQKKAISLHWAKNKHHPEYYENPNDMADLDLMEFACDLCARSKQHGTDPLEYLEKQQDLRYHFDTEHLKKAKQYITAIKSFMIKDDFADILSDVNKLCFKLKDSTMEKLENFDESCYVECIKTDRLYLQKERDSDFASVSYGIYLRDDNTEIGTIYLKFNNYFDYKIYRDYLGNGYTKEVLTKFIEISLMDDLFIKVRKANVSVIEDLESLGFTPVECSVNTVTYRYKKEKHIERKTDNKLLEMKKRNNKKNTTL